MDGAWGLGVGIASLVVNGVGLAFVAVQVSLARRQASKAQAREIDELHRRKMDSTLRFYMITMDHRRALSAVPDEFDAAGIEAYCDLAERGDAEAFGLLKQYLGFFETFAVGISSGIYDLEIADALTGGRVIALAENYAPYLAWVRSESGSESRYSELDWLATELKRLRSAGGPYVPLGQRDSVTAEPDRKLLGPKPKVR